VSAIVQSSIWLTAGVGHCSVKYMANCRCRPLFSQVYGPRCVGPRAGLGALEKKFPVGSLKIFLGNQSLIFTK
jgi:hypothetical protein